MESKDESIKNNEKELENDIEKDDEKVEDEVENISSDNDDLKVDEDEKVKSLNEEISSLNNSLALLQADFINYKNRINKEKALSIKLANEGLIMKLLPVLDDLERAFEHLPKDSEFSEGISIIISNFIEILKKEGLEEIESTGKPFDHNFHQAILMEPNDEIESGNIIETFQKGYVLNGKVIRPSMVKVSE
ncbi:nucleotide exchange factor GrpE [Lagierella sp.]|uniref:nucleotide exchange factor GrpE n=1 Tax=Lagierella sp. TaxID=2849657 RepID=UPI0026178425|nr:nucleotide exchange factor GrpE [Lagierella sp.]